jgi:hypothetical protein
MRTASGLVLALLIAGCSSSGAPAPSGPGDDGKLIADLIEQMNDDGGRDRQLKTMFAAGSPAGKAEARAFQQYRFDLKGKPNVSGTTATATVVLEKHKGGTPAEKEWAFVKEGDKWKIKDAPLP